MVVFLYATLVNVPAVFISFPFNCSEVVPFILATLNVPLVPLSTSVARVFASPSLIVNVPLTPAVAKVTIGDALLSVRGDPPDNVTVPEAAIVVAAAIAPVALMPPALLFIPPLTDNPPALIVCAAVKVLD